MSLAELAHRFSVDDVLRMASLGAFDEGPKLELLDGRLLTMTPQGGDHIGTTHALARALRSAYDDAWTVLEEKPLRVGDANLPEPDLQVLRVPAARFWGVPDAADAVLVVEVAVSSRAIDIHKAGVYAAGHIPVYWLVDVPRASVIVWSDPSHGEYRRRVTLGRDGVLTLPELDGTVPVASFLRT